MVSGATIFSLIPFACRRKPGTKTNAKDHRFLLLDNCESNIQVADIRNVKVTIRDVQFNIIRHGLPGNGAMIHSVGNRSRIIS